MIGIKAARNLTSEEAYHTASRDTPIKHQFEKRPQRSVTRVTTFVMLRVVAASIATSVAVESEYNATLNQMPEKRHF